MDTATTIQIFTAVGVGAVLGTAFAIRRELGQLRAIVERLLESKPGDREPA